MHDLPGCLPVERQPGMGGGHHTVVGQPRPVRLGQADGPVRIPALGTEQAAQAERPVAGDLADPDCAGAALLRLAQQLPAAAQQPAKAQLAQLARGLAAGQGVPRQTRALTGNPGCCCRACSAINPPRL
jgi:hypothetical protein